MGRGGYQRASPGLYSVSPEDTCEMRLEDRHSFRANWLLRAWGGGRRGGVGLVGGRNRIGERWARTVAPHPDRARPALILTSEGCPAPTTISLPSSRPTSTWLRSLVTATLRMGTFMGRGGAAGSSLQGGRGIAEVSAARELCVFILPCTLSVAFEGMAQLKP